METIYKVNAQARFVRIIAEDRLSMNRTGLRIGAIAEVLPVEGDDRLWVKCPEIEVERDGIWTSRSDGYATLDEGEYEEL